MKTIKISVRDKIAINMSNIPYTCGNSDFVINFDFDAEWDEFSVKTARFIKDDRTYQDQVFQGNECPVPVIYNTNKIRVGVFAGNLHTSTPAIVKANKGILCVGGSPESPAEDVYAQIMEILKNGIGVSKASELENDVPFVSAGDAQTLTDAQKEQARVNIGASHIRVKSTNIGGDTLIEVVVTDADGSVSRFNPKGSDGGVWVPKHNEETGVINWKYYRASDFYPEPSPVPTGIPVPNTAAVGQTIVVSEVDAEGKPTKWEARDVGSGGTTTQMVSTTVTVGTEPVILDDTAPEQEVLLAWDAPEARTVPAFTNYYIPRSNISYPRTFNANAHTQFASNSAAHGNADTFVAGHTYFQALRYEMDGDSVAMLYGLSDWFADVEYGSADETADGSIRLTGRGWVYTLTTPGAVGQFSTRFNTDGSGTGTVRYLYCIDVTALAESGVIESTSVAYLAELFGGLELIPGQNFEGANYGTSMKLTITRGVERIEVEGGTEKTTVIGGDELSTDAGKVTFVLKVPKAVSTNGASVSGGCDWSGKKWVAFGDSLTAEFINADKKYYRHIEGKTGINVVVMGVGSTGYAKNYGGGTSYGERMAACPSDADVITIFGSINDWNTLNTGGVQIGSPYDSLDAGTYSGYVNNCIDVAISKAPYAQIALVSPMFYRGLPLDIQESISAALKAVAEYRRIKFLDLYHGSGFRIENDTFAQAYTTDYSATAEAFGHPNNLAHEQLIAPEFMELLRRMLLS